MAYEVFAHNPNTTVSSGGTDTPSGGTSQSWTVVSSALFPAITSGTSQFHVADPAAPTELITVTSVSGTTWTVTRGAGGTTPVAHTAGFTVYQVAPAGFLNSPAFSGAVVPAASALTDGASIAVDASKGNLFTVTLGGSRAMADPSNGLDGQHVVFAVTQDATGSRTLTWGNAYSFGAGGAPALSVTPSATDLLGFVYSAASGKWLFAGTAQGGAGAKAWQFFPETYGAKGDGKIGTGGTGTSGTATFTDAAASWTQADVGKRIIINQGAKGAFQNPFCGSISAVNSSTSVTLSGNLAANAASAPYIYGTDDATAITAAVNAAATFAQLTGGPYHAQIIFGAKNYMLAALTQVQGTGTTTGYNTHIPVPVGPQNGQKLVIDLVGVGAGMSAGNAQWLGTVPELHGTCLVSTLFATGQPDPTFGQLSVVGGPTYVGVGPLANTVLVVDGITTVAPWNSPTDGVNGFLLTQMNVPDGAYLGFAPINGNNLTVGGPSFQANGFISAGSHAFVFPNFLNNDSNNVGLISVQGAGTGVQLTEHFTAQKLNLIYCSRAMAAVNVSTAYHGATILHCSSEGTDTVLYCSGSGSGRFPVWIGLMDTEFINSWMINDSGNFLGGVVYWSTADGAALHPAVNGAQNLTVLDFTHNGPGPWSGAPAAPSSGGASSNTQQNNSYRYATVYASATTSITNVYVGQGSTGLTATGLASGAGVVVPIRVPPGAYYAVAYTGALTTHWYLD